MQKRFWWEGLEYEKYWLEITNRADIGADLNAPQHDGRNKAHWTYALLTSVMPGDIVFHYHSKRRQIEGASQAVDRARESQVLWRSQTGKGNPFTRPGWRVKLGTYVRLNEPITLDAIRSKGAEIETHTKILGANSRYKPFVPYGGGPIRAAQAYIAKLPRFYLTIFPDLAVAATTIESQSTNAPLNDSVINPEVLQDLEGRDVELDFDQEAFSHEIQHRVEVDQDYRVPDQWGRRRVRTGVAYWRKRVLENCRNQCVVCGLAVPMLLEAAHIRSWSEFPQHRLNPGNGLALCALHHRAFDRRLLELDPGGLIVVAHALLNSPSPLINQLFGQYHETSLPKPVRWQYLLTSPESSAHGK